MNPGRAREIIVVSMVGTGAAVTLGGLSQGKPPSPRRYLALGLVFIGTSVIATASPKLGAGFAGLVLAGTVLNAATGEKAASAVLKAATSKGPITPANASPVAARAAAGGSASAAVPGSGIGVGSPALGSNRNPAPSSGSVTYPLAIKGPVIGRPGQGTHSFSSPPDNWQSDNAVDIGVPIGTPVFAPVTGTIGPQIGSLGSSGRFAGQRLTVVGDNGQSWYLAHLSVLSVKAGERVNAGQMVGLSGSANGVPHLHAAVNPPYDIVRLLGI